VPNNNFYIQISIELLGVYSSDLLGLRLILNEGGLPKLYLMIFVLFLIFVVNPLLFKVIIAFMRLGQSSGITD
jgi:hypothetical protein